MKLEQRVTLTELSDFIDFPKFRNLDRLGVTTDAKFTTEVTQVIPSRNFGNYSNIVFRVVQGRPNF